MSPPSISISRDLGIARLGDAGQAGLRAGQDQGDRRRRVGQVGAFQLEGGVGAPHAHVGLGVGVQVVDRGDQLAGAVRAGGENLAEVGEVGGVGVGDGEVQRCRARRRWAPGIPPGAWFRRRSRRSAGR